MKFSTQGIFASKVCYRL